MEWPHWKQVLMAIYEDAVKAIRVKVTGTVEGSFAPSGLRQGGLDQLIDIPSTTWTKLPTVNLAVRNSLRVQNIGTVEIKTTVNSNPNNDPGGPPQDYEIGILIPIGTSDFVDITKDINIYARTKTGTGRVALREIG